MPVYHVWFGTKWRKWLLDGELDEMVKAIIRDVAIEKEIELMECETAIDHVHVLVRCDDRTALSRAMNYIKGLSAKRLFDTIPELKMEIGMNNFWQHRFGCKLVPEGAITGTANYVRTQKDRLDKYER